AADLKVASRRTGFAVGAVLAGRTGGRDELPSVARSMSRLDCRVGDCLPCRSFVKVKLSRITDAPGLPFLDDGDEARLAALALQAALAFVAFLALAGRALLALRALFAALAALAGDAAPAGRPVATYRPLNAVRAALALFSRLATLAALARFA